MTYSLIAPAMLMLMLGFAPAPPPAQSQGGVRIVPNLEKPADAEATQAPPSGAVTAPVWLKLPTSAEFNAHRSARATRMGRTGSAVMRCVVKSDGGLDQCVALSETPAGLGFGASAVDMAGLFQMAAKTTDGLAVGGADHHPDRRVRATDLTPGVTSVTVSILRRM